MRQGTRDLTVTLTVDEANAAVEAIGLAITAEAGELEHAGMDCPGDLHRLGRQAARIGTFAHVGKALQWRKHWSMHDDKPDAVTTSEAVWVDLLKELQDHAEDMRTAEVDPRDRYAFDAAARTVARTFAEAEVAEGDR